MEVKIAIAQMDVKLKNKEDNLKKLEEFAEKSSEQGADFLCLPEYFSTGSVPEDFSNLAETIPGKTTDRMCEISRKNKIYIVASLPEKESEKIYNTAVLINPEGELIAKHRKIHLFLDEKNNVSNGENFVVAETKFGKIGLMVCYDTVFPEVARELTLQGAEIIFVPANWPNPFSSQWETATNARALDNQIWIVASNRAGKDDKFTYFGNSRVVSPYGNCVAECNDAEQMITTVINTEINKEFRQTVDFFKDRQPEIYERNKKLQGDIDGKQ